MGCSSKQDTRGAQPPREGIGRLASGPGAHSEMLPRSVLAWCIVPVALLPCFDAGSNTEAQVREFYEEHNPEKLSILNKILFRYKGKEDQVCI